MGKIDRVRDHLHECRRLTDRIEQLEALAEKVTPSITGMPKATGQNKDDVWARLIDARIECEGQLREYLKEYRCLEHELDTLKLKSERVRSALKYRYLDGMSVEAIADKMELETRSVYRILKRGKQLYYEQIDETK